MVKKLYNCEQRERKTLGTKQPAAGFDEPSESEGYSETMKQTAEPLTQKIPSSSNMFSKTWQKILIPKKLSKRPNEVGQTRHVVGSPTKLMGPYRPYMPCRFYLPYHPFMSCIPYRSYRTFRNEKTRKTTAKPTETAQHSGSMKRKQNVLGLQD